MSNEKGKRLEFMTEPSALDKKTGTVSEIHDTTKILIRKSRNLKSSLTPKALNPS